ncbi:CNNM domain-containing protein [Planctomycetota bacterium]
MISLLLSIGIVLAATVLSGVFSGAETGLYQMSRLRLRLAVQQKQRRAYLLSRVLHDRAGLLTALLVGNNLTIQLATSTVTYLVVQYSHHTHATEWIVMAIATPWLFVFAELLPKNLFLYRADALMLWVSPVIYSIDRLARGSGVIKLLQYIATVFTRTLGAPAPSQVAESHFRRHEIRVLLKDTQDEEFLSGLQTGIMNRMMAAAVTPVKDVMTRMSQADKISVHSNRQAVMTYLQSHSFTRVVVHDGVSGGILGRINIYDVLGSEQPFDSLHDFIKPMHSISDKTPVTEAIDIMQKQQRKILLVTRTGRSSHSRPVGIVTMKDLAEEFLGELAAW